MRDESRLLRDEEEMLLEEVELSLVRLEVALDRRVAIVTMRDPGSGVAQKERATETHDWKLPGVVTFLAASTRKSTDTTS